MCTDTTELDGMAKVIRFTYCALELFGVAGNLVCWSLVVLLTKHNINLKIL